MTRNPRRHLDFSSEFEGVFLCMNKVREFNRVANEKYGRIIADQIIIAFIRIKFHSESARVPDCVRRTILTATVEKRTNNGVRLPTSEKKLAFVYFVKSCVTSK